MGCATAKIIFALPPGALGRGQKVKYYLISITKSVSKIFIPNVVCVLTNERYKTYQTGFLFCRLGDALLNHWTKFNQIWCVSYSNEWGLQRHFFRALGRGQKVKYHFISITKSLSKIFIPMSCRRDGTLGCLGCPGGQ